MPTPAALLAAAAKRDSARPLVTWYDDASGDRVELSVATAANWAAKTANLLVDELDLAAGDAVRLDPASHWLSVVVALGAWTAGVTVTDAGPDVVALPGDAATFTATVLPQPDLLTAAAASPRDTALAYGTRSWTLEELAGAATDAVSHHRLGDGARILSVLPLNTIDGIDAGLLVPLACNGSVVLVANADAARLPDRAAAERVTHTAGVDVDGLPRVV